MKVGKSIPSSCKPRACWLITARCARHNSGPPANAKQIPDRAIDRGSSFLAIACNECCASAVMAVLTPRNGCALVAASAAENPRYEKAPPERGLFCRRASVQEPRRDGDEVHHQHRRLTPDHALDAAERRTGGDHALHALHVVFE